MTDGFDSLSTPARLREKRFPFAPYPNGWFQIAFSRYTFFVQTDTETGEMSRMGLGFARDFCKQIEPFWESTIYRDRPQLARGESAITEIRSWARQSCEGADA